MLPFHPALLGSLLSAPPMFFAPTYSWPSRGRSPGGRAHRRWRLQRSSGRARR